MKNTSQRYTHNVGIPGVINLGCVVRKKVWIQYYITELAFF